MVTDGQLDTKPIAAGATSPLPLHSLSAPPHALQIVTTFLVSALPMSSIAFPSPGFGHGFVCRPFKRASQHFCMAFERAPRYFDVALPTACWHLLVVLLVPNWPCTIAP